MAKPAFDPNKPYEVMKESKPPFDPNKPFEFVKEPEIMSTPEAALIGVQKGATFGLRPAIAGLGAGAGAIYGEAEKGMKQGEGIVDYIKRISSKAPEAYQEARKSALLEQEKAAIERPGTSMVSEIGGMALTAPFTAAKGISGAAKLGAVQAGGQAISEEQSLPEAAKSVAQGAGLGILSYGVAKGVEKAYPKVKQAISSATTFLGDKAKAAFVKTANALTGETEKNIKTFIDKHDKIEKIIAQSGGDIGVAADNVRTELQKQIQNFRRSQNQTIGDALENVSKEKIVSANSVIDSLEKAKSKINYSLHPEAIDQIDDIANRISQAAGPEGRLTLKELYEVQNFLYDRAKPSYMKAGQIFMPGKESQQAAKMAAREAKIILDKSVPELRSANEALSKLHKIEENINKNLIAPGKSESALLAAGGATQGRNRIYLDQLGKIVGKDVIGEAENLASAAAFARPQLMPKSAGGTTSTSRTLIGAATGGVLAGPMGGAVGAALTSPAALKQAINVGLISKDVLEQTLGKAINYADEKVMNNLVNYLQTPSGQALLNRAVQTGAQQSAIQRRMNNMNGVK